MVNIEKLGYSEIRSIVKKRFLRECSICDNNCIGNITRGNVAHLMKLYDSMILDDYIKNNIEGGVAVSVSSRMSKSGGKTIYTKLRERKIFEVRISIPVLNVYTQKDGSPKKVCGIDAYDMVDALMLIVEHEICHIIEFNTYGTSNCRGRRFKEMASKVFGHTSSYHEILKGRNELHKQQGTFKCGQRVCFRHRNDVYRGIISNINKRATVMVRDAGGAYWDDEGIRYNKWYVPLNALIKGDGSSD